MRVFGKLFKKQQEVPPSIPVENIDGISLLEQHENGVLDDISFLSSFIGAKVFYSTPLGDHKDGGSRLFALPAEDQTAYLPAFTSLERAKEFYEKVGRRGFLLMENSFGTFLETIIKINAGNLPIKFGAVIDPGYYGVTVSAHILDVLADGMK